jgi:membrane protease subunit HflC
MRIALLTLVVVVLGAGAVMTVFTVDPTEYVYVTEFGRHIATYDGSQTETDAGLHYRRPWPVQSVRRLDRRLQHFDLPATELLTRVSAGGGDKPGTGTVDKILAVEAYVCWRIADKDAVDRFVRRIDTPDRAKLILGQRINSELGALIGQMRMDDLVSTEVVHQASDVVTKVDRNMEELRSKLRGRLLKPVKDEYGIEIVDIRLRRFNHPIKVRDAVFARIAAERGNEVARYQSEATFKATEIATRTEGQVAEVLANARKEETKIKKEGETAAGLIQTEAFRKDKDFFIFWESLEQMQTVLGDNRTVLMLSTHHPMFRWIRRPPGEGEENRRAPGSKEGKQ